MVEVEAESERPIARSQTRTSAGGISFAVVVPTYNNARTLPDILARLGRLGLGVIVVDDGATDATPAVLAAWMRAEEERAGARRVEVLRHACNQGKAAALQSGFAAARRAGYTHAVTIDSDGQLDPEEIPGLVAAARAHPAALVLGVRDASRPDYPARSRWGRAASNWLIRIESGCVVGDSQCGLRVYPLALVGDLPCRAGGFGFETEVITRAAWAGCGIREVNVGCRYFPAVDRVSHFRPWRDTLLSLAMHARLLCGSLWRRRRYAEQWDAHPYARPGLHRGYRASGLGTGLGAGGDEHASCPADVSSPAAAHSVIRGS